MLVNLILVINFFGLKIKNLGFINLVAETAEFMKNKHFQICDYF
jgi:hypothetical protein